MKALEKARSLLEAAELGMSTDPMMRSSNQRDLARAWLELARTQHACGIADAAPAPVEAAKPAYGKGGRQ